MRHPWARRVFIGLILAFPLLISMVASPLPGSVSAGLRALRPVLAVETVLVGGLVFARRERRRLLSELEAVGTAPARIVSRPSPARGNQAAPAWRSVSGSPGV